MNKEKRNNGKKKLIITMAVALILLVGVTVSYGYIALVSNSKNQEVSVGTGSIHLELDDADSGSVDANLNLGGSVTKTLKITNKGTKPGKVQINWKNLINTYNSRSLSYTLEKSNNKTSGYTKVESLRENVPVSTEAKEVPLSKELTIPVGSSPIYYRVTITFNDLEDVDQESDISAKLITEFSLTEPENISKKVIAVLNGNVKSGTPDFSGPAPRYVYDITKRVSSQVSVEDCIESENNYIVYGDSYELGKDGKLHLINPQVGKYKDIYNSLIGKYTMLVYDANRDIALKNSNDANGDTFIMQIKNATSSSIDYDEYYTKKIYGENEYGDVSSQNMSSYKNNYMIYASEYQFDHLNGRYSLVNPQVCKYSECYSTLVGKYVLILTGRTTSEIINNPAPNVSKIESAEANSFSYRRKTRYQDVIDYSSDGVYTSEDDYGDSYYYRGAIENNYFKFGGLTWRIIRVNGDGSIRLFTYQNTTGNLTRANRTAGYMIGIDESTDAYSTSKQEADRNTYDSPLKKAIDTWYETNLKTNAANGNKDMGIYLSDTLFCSDRSVAPSANLWDENDTALGYGKNRTFYGTYNRIKNNTPSLKCPLKNDRFTVSDTKVGNGALKYKIATITGDEMMMAGVTDTPLALTTKDYLYFTALGMHTMSPSRLDSSIESSSSSYISDVQRISIRLFSLGYATNLYEAPVINIAPEYALRVIGSGTLADPFMIQGVA